MAIKLRTKRKLIGQGLLVLVFVIGICMTLYYLLDHVWNGAFVNWFSENYMRLHPVDRADGTEVYIWQPYWPSVKILLLWLLIFNVLFWLAVVYGVSHYYSRKQLRSAVTEISDMMRSYMNEDVAAARVFPKEYAEISSQMAELKPNMQRHEQMLKEEATRKNDLITYLAHDLKTPLTSVIGYLTLLDEAPDMPAAQKGKYVHIALTKANRLEKLINEFFEITRYNLQQIILEKERVDLYYLLVQMSDEFYPLLEAHGNTIKLSGDENLTVYGDGEKLARVFNNILKNAIAYSYADTEITVTVSQMAQEAQIVIGNHGKTIPPQKLQSIFDKFFRLDDARATNTGGAGLGLAIAREIVQLHGGAITASSENEWTSFVVTLPL